MSNSNVYVEQILDLIKTLSYEDKILVFTALSEDVESLSSQINSDCDAETKTWLDSDLENDALEDWDITDFSLGQPVEYIPNQGLVIGGDKTDG